MCRAAARHTQAPQTSSLQLPGLHTRHTAECWVRWPALPVSSGAMAPEGPSWPCTAAAGQVHLSGPSLRTVILRMLKMVQCPPWGSQAGRSGFEWCLPVWTSMSWALVPENRTLLETGSLQMWCSEGSEMRSPWRRVALHPMTGSF